MTDFNDVIKNHGGEALAQTIEAVIAQKKGKMRRLGRSYGMIRTSTWTDPVFREFRKCSCEAQRLYFYLLSSPSANMLGLYRQTLGSIADDIVCETNSVFDALTELQEKELVRYDKDNNWVWVVDLFAAQVELTKDGVLKPNDNFLKGVLAQLEGMPSIPLKKDFLNRYGSLLLC
jgi:hypothetical protein